MKGNERLDKFLILQDKNVSIEDIAKEIGITVKTLRGFLNRNGYKLKDGKYISKELADETNQISFKQVNSKVKQDTKNKKQTTKKNAADMTKIEGGSKTIKAKKDRKINITQEDLDKLCEVYDWYMQVKDYRAIKPKAVSSKKDVIIEKDNTKELRTTSVRVDKSTWEEFERLCSNSSFNKQEILTQALKDFMKQYKHLL